MRIRSRAISTAAVLAALALAASPAWAAHVRANARVWFPLNMLPLGHATTLGAARPAQTMTIGIGLKDPNAAAEQSLLSALENPASPDYHHFLTPAQFNERFAVPQATLTRVQSWLRGAGVRSLLVAGARNYIEVKATAAQVDRLFGTQINGYVAKGVHFLANATPPSVPAGLDILAILGLNTLQHPTTPLARAHQGARAPGSSVLGLSTTPASLSSLAGESPLLQSLVGGLPTIPAVLTPQELWSIYDMPSNNTGQGQSIAIMGAGDSSTVRKDLATFEQGHGLPKVPVTVTDIPAGGDFSDTSGNVEWELDTQAATGVAPGVSQVHLYFSEQLTDPDVEADFVTWVGDPNGPAQANASIGECETTPLNATVESLVPPQLNNNENPAAVYGTGAPDNLEPVAEQTLRQGALEGRTLFAATGDTGSSCPVLVLGPQLGAGNGILNQVVPIVNYPAVSQYAVAVGGTVLYPNGSTPAERGLEYPWPYTGGGQSFFVTAPGFQQGVANINRPCLSDLNGNLNTSLATCRGIPDVAAMSGDIATSSYDVYSDELGGASSEGGTSLASPLMAGMWARIQAASAGGTGFADPVIYSVAKNAGEYANDFTDYQLGINGLYTAGPGWDYVSGWGTPVLANLMTDIDGTTTPR